MKNIGTFIKGLEILAKYSDEGLETSYFLDAEHDVIYTHVEPEDLTEDSEDGKLLLEYGFHVADCSWAYFT